MATDEFSRGIDLAVKIPILEGVTNYKEFSARLEYAVLSRGIWDIVNGLEPRPLNGLIMPAATTTSSDGSSNAPGILLSTGTGRSPEQVSWDRKDGYCRALICLHVNSDIRDEIHELKTSHEQWEQLKIYKEAGFALRSDLTMQFHEITQYDYPNVDKFSQAFSSLIQRMKAIGIENDDMTICIIFLARLDTKFSAWVSAKRTELRVEQNKDPRYKPKLSELIIEIKEEEQHRTTSATHAALAASRRKGGETTTTTPAANANVVNNNNSSNKKKKKDKDKKKDNKDVIKCKTCNGQGHNEDTCYIGHPEKAPDGWKPRNDDRAKAFDTAKTKLSNKEKPQGRGNSNATRVGLAAINSDTLERAKAFSLAAKINMHNQFILDTGCTDHMCNDRDKFTNYHPVYEEIRGATSYSLGRGDVEMTLRLPDGSHKEVFLQDVMHTPDLFTNLVSGSTLRRRGVAFDTAHGRIYRMEDDQTLGQAPLMPFDLFVMDIARFGSGDTQDPIALLAIDNNFVYDDSSDEHIALPNATETTKLWHKRLGHTSYRKVKEMLSRAGVEHDAEVEICDACYKSKSKRYISKDPMPRASRIGEIIHTDVFSVKPIGINKERYFVLFTDDYSRARWMFTLKYKGEAHLKVAELNEMLKNKIGRGIGILHLDNGLEYGGTKLYEYAAQHGIKVETTVPYNPNQNPVGERAGGVVNEKIRTMLIDSGLPLYLWPWALATAIYLLNRTPTRYALGGASGEMISPVESWERSFTGDPDSSAPPDLSHLRAYGCKAYVHIPQEKRIKSRKYEARGQEGYLVGYDGSSIYHIYIPANRTVVRTSSVKFDETKLYKDRSNTDAIDTYGEPFSLEPFLIFAEDLPLAEDIDKDMRTNNSGAPDFDDDDTFDKAPGETQQEIQQEEPRVPPTPEVETPPQPPAPKPKQRRRGENLGPPPDVTGKRERKPTSKYPVDTYDTANEINKGRRAMLATAAASMSMLFVTAMEGFAAQAMSTVKKKEYNIRNVDYSEPQTYKQAVDGPESHHWKSAIAEEVEALQSNNTWKLVPITSLPLSAYILGGRYVFKKKIGPNGEISRYKARWVAKGYAQRPGVDFLETRANVTRPQTWRILFAMACYYDWHIEAMDVTTAFLYGDIDVELYMEQPPGHAIDGMICLLLKTLYGLKQSGNIWSSVLTKFLISIGFTPLDSDPCVFVRDIGTKTAVYIVTYIDDLNIIGPCIQTINGVKDDLNARFKMKDLGPVSYYLGMRIQRDRIKGTLAIDQTGYVLRFLEELGYTPATGGSHSKGVATPMDSTIKLTKNAAQADQQNISHYQMAIGKIMYAAFGSRPDITYAVCALARYAMNPSEQHMLALKHLLRYLLGTAHYSIMYSRTRHPDHPYIPFDSYSDTDHAGDIDTSRSTTGYIFKLAGGPISWQSKLQKTVALSSTESEYMGLTETTKEAIWLERIITELGNEIQLPTIIYEDNVSSINMAENAVGTYHARTKHIRIRHHFVRQMVYEGQIAIVYIPSADMPADGLTKPLPKHLLEKSVRLMGLVNIEKSSDKSSSLGGCVEA